MAIARGAHLGSLYDGFDTSFLAAGLERPPLMTALAMPFAAVPALRDGGLAAALGPALLGGASVLSAYGLARWAGMGRLPTALFVAAFALHPLLVVSGAIDLPEALYASLLLTAVGQFMRWLDREGVGPVVGASSVLGIAYLLRYNSLLIVAVMAFAFSWVSINRGSAHDRHDRAQATAMAFVVPVFFAVGLWGVIAWFPHADVGEFLRLASRLSQIGADDADVVRRMNDFRLDAPAVAAWIGGWSALLAPLSVLAIVAVAAHGAIRRSRESAALALVFAGLLAPEAVTLLTGAGQAHVPHLFVFVVPAFAAVAYRERLTAGGTRPGPYDSRRKRAQLAAAGALLAAAAASLAVLPLLPASDAPAADVLARLRNRTHTSDRAAEAVADWIRLSAGPGDVLVDPDRAAAIMLATEDFTLFRTPADEGDDAVLFDPFGLARFILVRRPLPGAGPGIVERTHAGLYEHGAPWASLAFEAGEYRVYAVEGAALR